MKFTIHKAPLRRLTDAVKGATGSSLSHPILEFLHLRATEEGIIELTGSNFQQTTVCRGEAISVEEPGEIMIPKKLCEFVKELPDAEIIISTNESNKISLRTGNYSATLPGDSCELFPPFSLVEGVSFKVDLAILKEWVRRESPVVSRESSRYDLAGVRLDRSNGVIRASATDGRRAAVCYKPLEGESFAATVPIDPLTDIVKSATEGPVIITVSDKKIQFQCGEGYISISSLLTNNFPNIDRIIPPEAPALFWLPRAETLKILKRLSYSVDTNINDVRLTLQDGVMTFSTQNNDAGANARETIEIDCKEAVTFRVNIRYLIDALSVCDGEQVRLELDADNFPNPPGKRSNPKPIPISDDREKFVYVLMPLKEAEEG